MRSTQQPPPKPTCVRDDLQANLPYRRIHPPNQHINHSVVYDAALVPERAAARDSSEFPLTLCGSGCVCWIRRLVHLRKDRCHAGKPIPNMRIGAGPSSSLILCIDQCVRHNTYHTNKAAGVLANAVTRIMKRGRPISIMNNHAGLSSLIVRVKDIVSISVQMLLLHVLIFLISTHHHYRHYHFLHRHTCVRETVLPSAWNGT